MTTNVGEADLRVVVVGSGRPAPERLLVDHLVSALRQAGHHVDEQPWRSVVRPPLRSPSAPDLILLIEGGPASVPGQLAATRAAHTGTAGRPIVALVVADEAGPAHAVDTALRRRLFAAVDIVVSHHSESGIRARGLGATESIVVPLPQERVAEDGTLSGGWARYVAQLETIAANAWADDPAATTQPPPRDPAGRPSALRERADSVAAAITSGTRSLLGRHREPLTIRFRDLPDWVRPTDVLTAGIEAREVLTLARRLGLPLTTRKVAAWAALGAISAILRVRDGDRRASVIVDIGGPGSVFTRWAGSIGYAPVGLDPAASIDPASLDVMAALHPHGCTSLDIEPTLVRASSLLRRGGLLIVTIPVGGAAVEAAVLPADLRGIIARADALGLVLVGDLDRDLAPLLTSLHQRIETDRPGARSARALVRLTFRRRS